MSCIPSSTQIVTVSYATSVDAVGVAGIYSARDHNVSAVGLTSPMRVETETQKAFET